MYTHEMQPKDCPTKYGVATIRRLPKNICL